MSDPEPTAGRASLYVSATKQQRRFLFWITLSLIFAIVNALIADDTTSRILFAVAAVLFAWVVQQGVRDVARRRQDQQ